MLNILTEVITPIEAGLWDTLQANYALVAGALTGVGATLLGAYVTIKGGLKSIGELLGKKKVDGDSLKTIAFNKAEAIKTATIRKGQLEIQLAGIKKELLDLDLKLDFVEKPDSKVKIETRMAELKAEQAIVKNELDLIDAKFNSVKDIVSKLWK